MRLIVEKLVNKKLRDVNFVSGRTSRNKLDAMTKENKNIFMPPSSNPRNPMTGMTRRKPAKDGMMSIMPVASPKLTGSGSHPPVLRDDQWFFDGTYRAV